MPIPDQQQPFPQRIRRVFNRTQGLHLPDRFSIQTLSTQGTPNDPSGQAQQIAAGAGSATITVGPPNPIIVDVPLQGLSTPFTASGPVSVTADAPIIALPEGMTLGSVTAQPMVVLDGTSSPIGASTIGRGLVVVRFLVRVTFHAGNFEAAGQQASVVASARLFTTS